MTDITGHWSINGNGSTGSMTILSVSPQGSLQVAVTFDGLARVDPWQGTWDDNAGQISLTRSLPDNVTQVYTGFLGSNDPAHIILAGSFTESDVSPGAPRTAFGWFAQFQSPIKRKEKDKEKDFKEKDFKEKDFKEKDFKEKDLEQAFTQRLDQLSLQVEQLTSGHAFIRPEERPAVGQQTAQEPEKPKGEDPAIQR